MNRRDVLRGAMGGAAFTVGMPWLEATASSSSGFPKRLVVWIWGNGTRPERWIPAVQGTGFALSQGLAPLAPVRDKIAVVSGLSVPYADNVRHWSGIGGLLTGTEVIGTEEDWTIGGPSLDQQVARAIGDDTVYRSLQIGVSTSNVFSFDGPHAHNPGEVDPYTLYTRLFGPTFVEPGSQRIEPKRGLGRSALDAVLADLNRLSDRVSSTDRVRIEQHVTGIRELEGRLARLELDPPGPACRRPPQPRESYPDIDGRPQLRERHAAHADLVAMALACDQTRVVTVQWSAPGDDTLYAGASAGHHTLTHDPARQDEVHAITAQIMHGFGDLLQKLDAVPEGAGTLLDHSLVLGCSDVGDGLEHGLDELPVVLAGGAGALQMGTHVRVAGRNSNALGLSVLRAMGVSAESCGAGEHAVFDGLSELEATSPLA